MIGKETTKMNREYYLDKARTLFDVFKDVLFPENLNGNGRNLMDKFERFALFHTRHMIENENEIKQLFKDFKDFNCSIVTTPGECVNPTDSLQIVAG